MSHPSIGTPARIMLVGVQGYGRVHAERIARLADRAEVELVAAVDPHHAAYASGIYGVGLYADLTDALGAVGPVDVVIIATPIGAHARLAQLALRSGADVYLEKPPVASMDDFARLLATEQQTGRVVQVGFQSLGSEALNLFAADAFGIGDVVRVGAIGAWSRNLGYWTRSPWAGHRSLDGQPVIDGVVTNPLAHAVATALAIVGCRRSDDVESVETDLYRANDIESDDTSVVRIATTAGIDVTCALTVCSPADHEPVVLVQGANAGVTFAYTADRMEQPNPDSPQNPLIRTVGRVDLLENLLAHRRHGAALLVPLVETGAFMRVLDAVATQVPVQIAAQYVQWPGEGSDQHAVVDDIEHWVTLAATTGMTFAELDAPWTRPKV